MEEKSTILVVDDDSAHRIMLRTLLGDWGYRVLMADNGSTAIQKVARQALI